MSRKYTREYKLEAIKLAREIGTKRAYEELQIPKDTLYGWIKAANRGEIDLGQGSRSPGESLTLAEELQELRRKCKALEKENARIAMENKFLEEASCFFAALRRK